MWCRRTSRVVKCRGHMMTIYEEQTPTLPPEMTMPSQSISPKTSGQYCRRLKYTEILGKRVACLRKWALPLGNSRANMVQQSNMIVCSFFCQTFQFLQHLCLYPTAICCP
ncbi:hypothetical protein BDQ94DRAFT_164613 [Aspergillus welwitschiae]|uniref:Uncharacterized protein n=1 Tax=Aspergillus welwitschiae TaxID=1341132 RepID=A0A3F3PHB5_9EURO|nr:hypothetical protein BDQ94DRAFT_164613 [Aspergillus welwitschiae]RDH26278.1 hypothetical protein BDQ94DRAFT_164613 [Aspergillus welwitschiae]